MNTSFAVIYSSLILFFNSNCLLFLMLCDALYKRLQSVRYSK